MSQPQQFGGYLPHDRSEVAALVPFSARHVLDVGCGAGALGEALRKRLGPDARIEGIEAVNAQARTARDRGCYDEVHDGYFPDVLPSASSVAFDVVIFADVLEHMVDPWEVLVATRLLLSPNGVVVASIPNVQFLQVVADLVRGRWDYKDSGVLDRTHLRFFTRTSAIDLFEQADFEVSKCVGVNALWRRGRSWRHRAVGILAHLSPATVRNMGYLQFVVVATSSASRQHSVYPKRGSSFGTQL